MSDTERTSIIEAILDFKAEMNQRFYDIEGKIDAKIDALDTKFEVRLDDLEDRLNERFLDFEDRMNVRFDRIDERFEYIEEGLLHLLPLTSRVAALEGKMRTHRH